MKKLLQTIFILSFFFLLQNTNAQFNSNSKKEGLYAFKGNDNILVPIKSKNIFVSALPIEDIKDTNNQKITEFKYLVYDGKAYLGISVNSNINDCIFMVERSYDGFNYEQISYKKSYGNNIKINDLIFYFQDEPTSPLCFYRIKQLNPKNINYSEEITLYDKNFNKNKKPNNVVILRTNILNNTDECNKKTFRVKKNRQGKIKKSFYKKFITSNEE